jgi:hypothetical protein
MSARWYPVKIKSNPQLLNASPTSIITVITSSSYGIASLSTQLGVIFLKEFNVTKSKEAEAPKKDETFARFQEDFREFVNEFRGESDRAAVILGASKLDQMLGMVLEKFLRPSANSTDDLFSNNGPLGTFSAKIELTYRLGLIDSSFCRSIHLSRRIRNNFAHEVYGASLSSGSHKDRVKSLVSLIKDHEWFSIIKNNYFDGADDPRSDFSAALGLMIVRLEGLLHHMESVSLENERSLVPTKYNKSSKKDAQKTRASS